jgi:hypothetical protein
VTITRRQAERAADVLGELLDLPHYDGRQRDEISRVRWLLIDLHEPCCSEFATGSGMHSDECAGRAAKDGPP